MLCRTEMAEEPAELADQSRFSRDLLIKKTFRARKQAVPIRYRKDLQHRSPETHSNR